MTAGEIIESGNLELYVCGALPANEEQEVLMAISKYPEVKEEIVRIESVLMQLSKNTAPSLTAMVWSDILSTIRSVKTIPKDTATNWASVLGWAAAILCLGGIFWMMNQNGTLKEEILLTQEENMELNKSLIEVETELATTANLFEILQSKDYKNIPLPGNQAVSPNAYAKVFYNTAENLAYIDIKGLPSAPQGKVYQVWSLILDPLTPKSLGLINDVTSVAENIYKFEDIQVAPEAFAITLEPEGGSETPTLAQLYTLGTVTP